MIQRAGTYDPRPVATGDVKLSDSLRALREELAAHVHDVWAARRIAEGWTYGPQRDDHQKQNPCLVPYAALPESEKEYDRATAEETLKAILALGYRIERSEG